MTIRSKVVGSFFIVSLLFVIITYANYSRSLAANRQLLLINELFLPLSRIVVQIQGHVHGLAEDSKRLQLLSADSSQKGTFSRMVRDLYPYLIFRKLTATEALLAQSRTMGFQLNIAPVAKQLFSIKRVLEKAANASTYAELEPIYREARTQLLDVSRMVDEQSQRVTSAAQRDAKDNLKLSAVFSALLLLVSVACVWVSSRALRPLPHLIESIKHNASGDFLKTVKVDPNGHNEFGVLAREYNKMLVALADRDKQIQSQQRELVQSERLATIGKLSAEIVHEIRNPLNAISLNIDWMACELTSPSPEIQKTLKSVSREVLRLTAITERYLMQARVSEKTEDLVEINELIKELVDFLKEEHRIRNIQVLQILDSGHVKVSADRSKLRQALLNILRNSKDAMPKGGTITIRSRVQNNTCEIAIEDKGCGMSKSTLQNTFRPFFSTKPNGNGLGLMLTRSAIEQSHGTLHLQSNLGQGTLCQIQLPVSVA